MAQRPFGPKERHEVFGAPDFVFYRVLSKFIFKPFYEFMQLSSSWKKTERKPSCVKYVCNTRKYTLWVCVCECVWVCVCVCERERERERRAHSKHYSHSWHTHNLALQVRYPPSTFFMRTITIAVGASKTHDWLANKFFLCCLPFFLLNPSRV